jgi:gluconate 2-dehydrogenase alpha chain
VRNRYLQCWDVPNVFSLGASAFPQNGAYNYSFTIGALTALDAIKNQYLKAVRWRFRTRLVRQAHGL